MNEITKMAPFAAEAEMGVLGALLMDPHRLLPVFRGKMRMTEEWFYVPAHRVIWSLVCRMADQNKPLDTLTVQERLDAEGLTEQAGGPVYLDKIWDATPTATHGEYYAETVQEKYWLRRIIDAARAAVGACYEAKSSQEVVSAALTAFQEIGAECVPETRSNVEVLDDLLANWQRAHDQRQKGEEAMPGLKMPFRRLNEIMGGLQPGLHFFGGKSSAGKTTLVINLCLKFLLDGKPGLMVQLDDTHEDVLGRVVSKLAGVSLPALAQGFAKNDQMAKIRDEIRGTIAAMPLHVVEECRDVNEARALARYHKAKNKIEWMVIDYVQVLDADGNVRDDERIRLGKIAAACKRLWKELRIPLLVVSQTARFKDGEDDGMKADMSDLFGASELFHAATTVTIAKAVREREERGKPLLPVEWAIDATGHTKKHAVALHVVKNKHGPKDCMCICWLLAKYFQFEETRFVHERGIWRQLTWQEDMTATGESTDVDNILPGDLNWIPAGG